MNTPYTPAPTPTDEAQRLRSLLALEVLDTAPDRELDALVKAASLVCEVPISLISLVDANRQWFKANHGLDATETARDISFCGHAIQNDDLFEISDAWNDPRFVANPLVTSGPEIRFYAGMPLKLRDGARVGTLCVIDSLPHTLTQAQRDILQHLATAAASILEKNAKAQNIAELQQRILLADQQRQEADQIIRSKEVHAKALIDAMYEGVVVQDANSTIVSCNHSAEEMLGLSFDQMIGRQSVDPSWRCVHENMQPWPGESHPAMVALTTGSEVRNAIMGVHKPDGTLTWISINAKPMYEDHSVNPASVICTFVDITERKAIEQRLILSTAQANEALLSKSQFLANMSHELRTPMNAVLGMLTLIGNTSLNANQRDYINKTEGAAKSLLTLLNDILDFSKVEAGKMTLDAVEFDTEVFFRDLGVVLTGNLGTKPIDVLYDLDPALPRAFLGDPMRLKQVMTNLAGNAIKFTNWGQVVIAVKVLSQSVVEGETRQRLTFSVQDTGIGIAAESQSRIFKGFSQAEASTSRRFGGTGLGLVISQRLVNLMGGTIQLSSELGVGSTFSFDIELPLASGAEAKPRSTPALRVLLVDDNPVARALLASTMRGLGWDVDAASSGHEALALCENLQSQAGSAPYDALFLDWQMHGLNGWDTLHRLRLLWRERAAHPPKVVMVSASSKHNLTQRTAAEQDSLNAFLTKPLTPGMVLEAVQQQAAGSRASLQPAPSSQRRLSGMRILVVEDNAINQQIAEELLTFEGALVSIAGDGQQGVNAVAAATPPFDAVLMDVQMPVMDGYDATRAIRSTLGLRDLTIVGLTANAMDDDRSACLDAGMNEHVGKPFDMDQLVALLLKLTSSD